MYLRSQLVGSSYTTIRHATPFGSMKHLRKNYSTQLKLQLYEHGAGVSNHVYCKCRVAIKKAIVGVGQIKLPKKWTSCHFVSESTPWQLSAVTM